LESHKWTSQQQQQQQQQSHRGGAPRGLVNLGNTCFLNATLQCLAYLPTFGQCIADLDPPPNNTNNTKQKSSKKGNNGQRTTLLLRSLLRKMHNLDEHQKAQASKNNPGGAIAPRNFVKVIPTLGGSGGHKFRPGRQEDAHEFLVHLLDAMKDGELGFAGKFVNVT
jgi:ubiquitin carboxyl-terminal hydrolase 36/42